MSMVNTQSLIMPHINLTKTTVGQFLNDFMKKEKHNMLYKLIVRAYDG